MNTAGPPMGAQEEVFAARYRASLREYLDCPGEVQRTRAYELGRSGLADGLGVLDVAAAHHEALRRLLPTAKTRSPPDAVLKTASDFFAESLSPYEMSHRGAREAARAWQRLNETLEDEAKRIAHALHDEAGQLLASAHLAVADIADELPAQSRTRLDKLRCLLGKIETELRNLSHELRPTVLDRLGLLPALRFLAENMARRGGISIAVRGELAGRLAPVVEMALYRIVQEALINVIKHARARGASVGLEIEPTRVSCTVRDDGVGFAVEQIARSEGLGLRGIRERLNALGGSLQIASRPQRGTTLRADIPRRCWT